MKPTFLPAFVALALSCSTSAAGIPSFGTIIARQADLLPSYDYVVVGGGVGGLVVANRLSEDPDSMSPHCRVLLRANNYSYCVGD